MNTVLKIFLSMSFSGGLLILALLLGKRFLKDKISRQWQYYIWLIVILRLLLPFGPETSLLGETYRAVDQAVMQAFGQAAGQTFDQATGQAIGQADGQSAPSPQEQPSLQEQPAPQEEPPSQKESAPSLNAPEQDFAQDMEALLMNHVWLVWLTVALGLLIRKITLYQGFIRYIHAGSTPISDIEMLNRLSAAAEKAGIKKPIELCVDPLISSPLLIGFFHPRIVLTETDISEKDFTYIVLHELTHYRRRDTVYKWLVQVTVCLHWFNPLVHLMSREITRACEFSCDEAVLVKMGEGSARDYGFTLLEAMAAVGKHKETPGAVTLSENKQLLKERIGAIMKFRKKSKTTQLLTGALTLCVILSATFVGVSPAAASSKSPGKSAIIKTNTYSSKYAFQAERYYKADSLPLFEIAFSHLSKSAQRKWLERLYADGDFAFFSAAVRGLDPDANSSLLADFAEKAYDDGEIAFFSILTDCMDETKLELWLDRALKDGDWAFQSMLHDKLDRDDESDKLKEKQEKEWAKAQTAEYKAVGVTMKGKNYYYRGKLVNIFLDIRADKSFYTLNINPKGTVNIKIIRNSKNKIKSVAYMTEAEVTKLLKDMGDDD